MKVQNPVRTGRPRPAVHDRKHWGKNGIRRSRLAGSPPGILCLYIFSGRVECHEGWDGGQGVKIPAAFINVTGCFFMTSLISQPVSKLIRFLWERASFRHGRRPASISQNHSLIIKIDIPDQRFIVRRQSFKGPVIRIPRHGQKHRLPIKTMILKEYLLLQQITCFRKLYVMS